MEALTHAYTGDGKGKTTAALGLALRAAGAGFSVLYTQFLKDGTSSELKLLQKIEGIECFPACRSFGFIKFMSPEELAQAKAYYGTYLEDIMEKIRSGSYQMLIMDEFMAGYNYDMIPKDKALAFLREQAGRVEIVLSGRDVPEEIALLCDYISDIKARKHPYTEGIPARLGIEM